MGRSRDKGDKERVFDFGSESMIRLHSGGENALALRALRGGRGDARELLATTRARPDQPIHQAAQRGDVDALRRELEKNGVTRNE